MALIKCHECNNMVSTEAQSCPQCGANPKVQVVTKPSRVFKILLCTIFLLFFFKMISDAIQDNGSPSLIEIERQRRASLTPEQAKAEDEAIEKYERSQYEKEMKESLEDSATKTCRDVVVAGLHDPDSSKMDDHRTYYRKKLKNGNFDVQVTGFAKNGFNALRKLTVDCKIKVTATDYKVLSLKELK